MLITQVTVDLLRLPLPRPRTLPRLEDADPGAPASEAMTVLVVQLAADSGLCGLGFSYTTASGRPLRAAVEDDLAPVVIGADPVEHERVLQRLPFDSPAVARTAVDL